MSWNDAYWSVMSNVYWTLDFVGLKRIDLERAPGFPEHYMVRKTDVPSGLIYTRRRKSSAMVSHLGSREETLNHILDIALAMAPDALLSRLIAEPLGMTDAGPFDYLGRRVHKRHEETGGPCQPDGFVVSPSSAVAIELKLLSPSSPEQLVKYALMLAAEERVRGRRDNLGLLYVVPEGREARVRGSLDLEAGPLGADYLQRVLSGKIPGKFRGELEKRADATAETLARMRIGVTSWTWFRDQIAAVESGLDESEPSRQCYRRLLRGLRDQIERHGRTGLTASAGVELVA